jgi:arylsulfatase A-like enzyme
VGIEGTPLARKNAAEVNAEFLEWVDALEDRPFFAFLNYFDAHDPYTPPPPFDTRFGHADPPPALEDDRRYSDQELAHLLDAYDGAVSYTDDQLGRLLDALEGRGMLDDTIVVITSDHGEQFGEHGLVDHANSLYRQLLHVPLVLSFPSRIPASRRVTEPVTLVDLPATILDLAGLSDARGQIPGRSMAGHWDPAGRADIGSRPILSEVSQGINTAEWLPISKGPMQSVVSDGMHYIRNGDGSEELYDFETDAAELNDLSSRPEARASLERLRTRIDQLMRSGPPVAARALGGPGFPLEDQGHRSVLHDMLVEQAPVVVPRTPVQSPVAERFDRPMRHEERMMGVVVGVQTLSAEREHAVETVHPAIDAIEVHFES